MGLLGLMMTAIRPGLAFGTDIELDGSAYGGTATSHWTCGPVARATYGGVGGEIRIRNGDYTPRGVEAIDYPPVGGVISVAAAAEHRSYALVHCESPCDSANGMVPPDGWLGAGRIRVGYEGNSVGFHAGPMLYPQYRANSSPRATYRAFPDAVLRIGHLDGVHGEVGLGAYNIPTLMHPGGYLGLGLRAGRVDLALRGGLHLIADDTLGARVDLGASIPVAEHAKIGVGVAGSYAEKRLDPELRAVVETRF